MAGNKKPRKPGKAPHVFVVLAKAEAERKQRAAKINARIARHNALPLGHPVNAHKIERTFKPLEAMLNEQERTGSLMFDEGNAVMWVPEEAVWTPIVAGLLELCHAFQLVGRALTWGEQPPGLRAFAIKLEHRLTIDNAADVPDARATLAWMRQRLGTISAGKWADTLAEADAIGKAQQQTTGETN